MGKVYNFEKEKMARARYNTRPIGDDLRWDPSISTNVIIGLVVLLISGAGYVYSLWRDHDSLEKLTTRVGMIEVDVAVVKDSVQMTEKNVNLLVGKLSFGK